MPYIAEKPSRAPSSEELRATIPGWGADLDPANRPSVPKLHVTPVPNGSHWDFPEAQEELEPREKSIEHAILTPVFGTSVPLRGVSGAIRRFAYDRYSEGRAAHWLLLVLGDRVDAIGSHAKSLLTLRPDNPFTETGLRGEVTGHGIRSRLGRGRADVKHQWMDPLLVAGPWLLVGGVVFWMLRKKK